MSNEVNVKRLSEAELMAADPSELSNDDLTRRINLANLRKAERELLLVEDQNLENAEKKADRKRIADHKTKTLAEEHARLDREQNGCKHKSGGKGLAGLFNGDGKWGYTVAAQVLPTGEIYYLCFRCQKEWRMPKKRDVLDGKITLAQYKVQEQAYEQVAAWDKPLFATDTGEIPGSVLFNIPHLNAQRAKDDAEFAVFLAKQ